MIGYYVTVIRGKRIGWLAGPYSTFEAAEATQPLATRIAREVDLWCDFDLFGVTKIERDHLPPGRLQDFVDEYEMYGVVNW